MSGVLTEELQALRDTAAAYLAGHANARDGRDGDRALWQGIAANCAAHFELEDVECHGPRAIIRWRYRWGDGAAESVRGVNLMRVEGGLIVEAMGYVKGK